MTMRCLRKRPSSSLLFPGSASTGLSLGTNFAVLALFTLIMFAFSFLVANRRTTKPAA